MSQPTDRSRRLAVIAGLCAFLVLAGPAVANAAWTAATSAGSSVTVATVDMTVTGHSALSTQYKFAGAATNSPVIIKPLPVTNTGTSPLNLALTVGGVSGNTLAPLVKVTLWKSAGTTCAATIPGTGTTVGTLADLPALPTGSTTAAEGTAFTLCVATSLNDTVATAQGLTVTPTFTVTGTVGTSPWTTFAAGAFTQSVYKMVDATALTCTEVSSVLISQTVTLAWTAPTGTGTTGTVTYRVVNADTNTVIRSGITATNTSIAYDDLSAATTNLLIQADESQYGTTSVGLPITVTRSLSLVLFGKTVSCP